MQAVSDEILVEVEIVNELGLHTRAATELVKIARQFASELRLSADDGHADAKNLLGLLTLGAKKGTRLTLKARGPDQEEAVRAVRVLIEAGFYEASE